MIQSNGWIRCDIDIKDFKRSKIRHFQERCMLCAQAKKKVNKTFFTKKKYSVACLTVETVGG